MKYLWLLWIQRKGVQREPINFLSEEKDCSGNLCLLTWQRNWNIYKPTNCRKASGRNLRHKCSFLGLLTSDLFVKCQTSPGILLWNMWTKNFVDGVFPLVSDELHPFRFTTLNESWVELSTFVLYTFFLVLFLQVIVWHKTRWTLTEPGMYFNCKAPSDILIIACSIIKTVNAFLSRRSNSC